MDVLLAIAIIGIAFTVLLSAASYALNFSSSTNKMFQANYLIKEEMDALRAYRDGVDWAGTGGLGSVSTGIGNPYYLAISSGKWVLNPGTDSGVGPFTRQIVFDYVSRNPGTLDVENPYNSYDRDPNTLKATVTVQWAGQSWSAQTYIVNYKR